MVDVSGAHSFSYLEEWSPIVLQDRKCTESVSSRKSHLRTVKILQNAFSHIMFLCPQRSDRAEKPETRNTRFSRQCALKTLLSGFGLKAFRKFTMKSAWGNIPDWCREGKPLFHPKHKPGIFCHTLSYCMTKMEIKLLTYRSLRRSIN